jgi:hypothetical protein
VRNKARIKSSHAESEVKIRLSAVKHFVFILDSK